MGFRFNDLGRLISERKFDLAKSLLVETLIAHGNNQVKAAKAIPVDYRTFTRWLKRLESEGHDVRKAVLAEQERRVAEEAKQRTEREEDFDAHVEKVVGGLAAPEPPAPVTAPAARPARRGGRPRSAAS